MQAQGVGSFQPFITAAQQQAADAGAQTGLAGTGISGAEGMLGSGAGTGTVGSIQDFMSPFQQQVIDTTLGEFDRQRQIQEQAIKDQQAQLGVLGAGRAGVQLAEFGSEAARQRACFITSRITTTRFQDAVARRQQDLANRQGLAQSRLGIGQAELGIGQFQAGLGSQVPGLQRADIQTLGQVGAAQQAQAQAQLDASREAARMAALNHKKELVSLVKV